MSVENTIQQFVNEELGANLRIIDRNGQPWFVAKDICDALGIVNVPDAVSRLDDDEKNTIVLSDRTPGNPNKAIVSESGLYNLVIRSDKPEAKIFKRWVTHEVLPSIRAHGAYMTDSVIEQVMHNPETIITMAETLLAERDRRQLAEERLNIFKPKMPFGSPSDINGRPRTKPISGYFRTTKTTTTITEVTEHQRRLFGFDDDLESPTPVIVE